MKKEKDKKKNKDIYKWSGITGLGILALIIAWLMGDEK